MDGREERVGVSEDLKGPAREKYMQRGERRGGGRAEQKTNKLGGCSMGRIAYTGWKPVPRVVSALSPLLRSPRRIGPAGEEKSAVASGMHGRDARDTSYAAWARVRRGGGGRRGLPRCVGRGGGSVGGRRGRPWGGPGHDRV